MIHQFDNKDPDSIEWFNFDFTAMLNTGDSIISILGVGVDDGDNAPTKFAFLDVPNLVTGTQIVGQRGTAGTRGVRYTIRARVATLLGETLDLSGYVYIDPQ